MTIIILAICAVLIVLCGYSMYVAVIQKKNKVFEAFSSIDVQLKKRYDLIPNILTIANKFMEHEKGLMEEVTKLRTQAMALPSDSNNIGKKFELDSQIRGLMGQIMVAVENYPQLKSDQTMMTAMQTYNEVEEHIAAARRFYNSAVYELNNAIEIFPSSVFATMIGATKQEYYKTESVERKEINVADYLK
jgi:LemA protein